MRCSERWCKIAPSFPFEAGEWLEALIDDLENAGIGEAFLTAIDLTSRLLMEREISVAELQNVLSALRREGCRALAGQPESACASREHLASGARIPERTGPAAAKAKTSTAE